MKLFKVNTGLILGLALIITVFTIVMYATNFFKINEPLLPVIHENKVSIVTFEPESMNYYLAINGEDTINYTLETSDGSSVAVDFGSENADIVKVDENGHLIGISVGNTKVHLSALDVDKAVDVYVTDMISLMPDEYNYDRKYLECNQYTKEENDFLDAILAERVRRAGDKTRAGVVAAARFVALEFPYRIGYFSENGRLDRNSGQAHVDGEGRYYHKGLYLSDSRYEIIEQKLRGPGTWGCPIYSVPSGHKVDNGFDCSGFISWILVQGGFDPGDIGAGITSIKDMTDLGEKIKLTDAIANNTIKAGDLLSGKGSGGGHIALVAGIDEGHYYVAESLWRGTGYFGALIRTYEKSKLTNNFYWQIAMDDFYQEEGQYTAYWK